MTKIRAYLEQPKHTPQGLGAVIDICRSFKASKLRDKAVRAAVPHWIDYDPHEWVFTRRTEELPADVKQQVVKLARATLADPKSMQHQKDYARRTISALSQ